MSIGIVSLITLVAFEAIGTATAMPVVAKDLDALAGYTWAFNAYIVASLFAMVLGGLWSDATGPRGPLIAGVASLSGGAVIAGAAFDLSSLVVGRALQGFGGGLLIVAVYVLIARAYPVDMRPKAFSVLAAAWVVPSLVGPVIAGWLSDAVTWRAVFWLVPIFVIPPHHPAVPAPVRASGRQAARVRETPPGCGRCRHARAAGGSGRRASQGAGRDRRGGAGGCSSSRCPSDRCCPRGRWCSDGACPRA